MSVVPVIAGAARAAAWLLAVWVASFLHGGRLLAQDLVAAARPNVASRQDLLDALRRADSPGSDLDVEAALIATWGEPVVSWAAEVVADERAQLAIRHTAMKVLYFARPQSSVDLLRRLATPRRGPEILWVGAMSALQSFPYPELADFWRGLLNDPEPNVRLWAMSGLSRTGTEADIPLIESARGGPGVDREKPFYVERLRRQLIDRGIDEIFGAPPGPDARFLPSARWLLIHRSYLCERAGCPR
jgi:hypothetical protein